MVMPMSRLTSSQRSRLSILGSAELLQRARAGEQRALSALLARYVPRLYRWAHRRVPTWARRAHDTDDLVQDALLYTMRNLNAFVPQGDGALLGYLRRALVNRVRTQFRYAARHPPAQSLSDALVHAGASPLDLTIDHENARRYRAGLERLRVADRAAIVARIELGYSYEQLALMLHKPTSVAARLAVRRALLRLDDEMRRA
jgi:RNA polymerase sigma factor (sigma-70 family)